MLHCTCTTHWHAPQICRVLLLPKKNSTNHRRMSRSCDLYWPIRAQYCLSHDLYRPLRTILPNACTILHVCIALFTDKRYTALWLDVRSQVTGGTRLSLVVGVRWLEGRLPIGLRGQTGWKVRYNVVQLSLQIQERIIYSLNLETLYKYNIIYFESLKLDHFA